jgi:hypothetical protein
MKKTITKLMSFSLALVITFGLTIMPNEVEAGTVYVASRQWVEVYGSVIYAETNLYGAKTPVGVTLGGGDTFVGMKEACLRDLSWTCDNSNLQLLTIMPLYSPTPE